MAAVDLSNPSFDPVAIVGLSELPGRGDPEAGVAEIVAEGEDDRVAAELFGTGFVRAEKVAAFGDPLLLGKDFRWRNAQRSKLTGRLRAAELSRPQTERRLRPLRRREEMTERPVLVRIRMRNP